MKYPHPFLLNNSKAQPPEYHVRRTHRDEWSSNLLSGYNDCLSLKTQKIKTKVFKLKRCLTKLKETSLKKIPTFFRLKNTLSFLLLFCAFNAFAQIGKGISIESTIHRGRIFKHSPKLVFDVPGSSNGIDINFKNQKYGKKKWHQYFNYPTFGVNLFFYNIGDKDVFGNAFGILPTWDIPILKMKKLDFQIQLGAGIAWLTQHYDPLKNTTNNAIGSNLNNITNFKFQFGYQLDSKWVLKSGFSFTHFSNAASQLPNFGINIPAFSLGLKYTPNPLQADDFIYHEDDGKPQRKIGLSAHVDIAYRELSVYNGPRFPIRIASLGGIYKINRVNHFYFGFDYEYNTAIYRFGLHTHYFREKEQARKESRRFALFIGHELLFGNIGFYGQLGYYLPTNAYLLPSSFYTKLSLRYYLPELGIKDLRTYLAIHIKAHETVAEYLSFGIGIKY